jgi:hypothetical protein
MKVRNLLFILAIGAMAFCCDEEKKNEDPGPSYLQIRPSLYAGNTEQFIGSIVSINDSTEASIETVRYYISHLRAVRSNGDTLSLADYSFFDLREPSTPNRPDWRTQRFEIPSGTYSGLVLSLGLDSTQNYSDPSTYPIENPLSSATGMYWTWATQYRFLMIEGRANAPGTVGGGNDQAFSYHPGGNHLYIENISLSSSFSVPSSGTLELELKMNIDSWFDGPGGSINPYAEFAAHDAPADQPLAIKFITNFASGLSL